MTLEIDDLDLSRFIVVGDRVLIKPKTTQSKTKSGLYLPPTVTEKENVSSGYVVKTGPGYPIPALIEAEEPWKDKRDEVKYVPLQAREGDLAVYLQNGSIEIVYKNEKYIIVPQASILLLIRDEELFK